MNVNSIIEKSQRDGIHVTNETIQRKSGTIYRSSGNLVIVKEVQKTVPHNFVNTSRGAITGFSPSSGVRMRKYLRECLPEYQQMVTLTYPGFFPLNGKLCKEHLKRFLQELSREYRRNDPGAAKGTHSSFWFLEFQQRGAPHFHIFTTWAPSKEWVARRWYEIVGSDDIRHLHAGTRSEFLRHGRKGTVSYASKYATKLEQKVCPENFENVGRWWGITGNRFTVSADAFVDRTERDALASKSAVKSFYFHLNRMFERGEAKILVREHGVLIVDVMDERMKLKIGYYIGRISCSVQKFSNMFWDADVDFGEDF